MPDMDALPGASGLIQWFGGWPSFHDAEVLSLSLERGSESRLRIHTWKNTGQTDANGFFVPEKHVVVTFVMTGVTGLELAGFSHQNVIFGLDLTQTETGFRLELYPCYGISGSLCCDAVSILFEPGPPG